MTQSTEGAGTAQAPRSAARHPREWLMWVIIVLAIPVVLMPGVPFPGYSVALAAIGVNCYLLGRRHVQREVAERERQYREQMYAAGFRILGEAPPETAVEVIDRMERRP